MDWAKDEAFLAARYADGHKVPAMENKPGQMAADLIPVWEAFWALSNSRQSAFGAGYIPISEIKAYVDLIGVASVETFFRLIREMDRVFVAWHNEREKEKANAKP